ncbi:MAG TPA: SUMF1/EgtB/PvdO family nonheme iron enzyme, partial [Gammaproteobacteria bacterium]
PGAAAAAELPVVPLQAPAPRRRGLLRLLAAAFVLLLLGAGFVLLATPVTLKVAPAPEALALRGFPPALPLGGRWLALPGDYTVNATLAGHRPLQAALAVRRDGPRAFAFTLAELPGRVGVSVTPEVPFTLQVDGVEVGLADGVAEIPGGVHTLRVASARHLPAEQTLEVAGRGATQQVAFTLQPAWAEVTLGSRPDGAAVSVDGAPAGATPLLLELLQGEHELLFELELHQPVRLLAQVEAGVPLRLDDVVLPPADGVLLLQSTPPGATVTVDGAYRGLTPLELPLAAAVEHRVRLALAGHHGAERSVQLRPEERRELAVALPAELGTLFVVATPADAALSVDGRPAGAATQRLQLPARAHLLEFSKPGYATQQLTVTPRPGVSRRVEVTLQPEAAARAAAQPETLAAPGGIELRLVRPGPPFRMGASRREAGRRANESARLVQLTRAFYLGTTEVTNAQYRQFKPGHLAGSAEGVTLDGERLPAVKLSWDDAARFCNWLSRQQGLPEAYREEGGRMLAVEPPNSGYRLPSEVEWAYVARALGREEPARYPWDGGYPPLQPAGNFADRRIADTLADTVPGYDDGYRGPAPVASFPAWPAGFHDLGGNVAEWTGDWYAVYPGAAERLEQDPRGPAGGEHRVVRGSSWRHGSVTELRLSYRDYSRGPRDDLGFRVARDAE